MTITLITPREAAQLIGVTPAGLRRIAIHVREARGLELLADRTLWPDQRTARYVREAVEEYAATTALRRRAAR